MDFPTQATTMPKRLLLLASLTEQRARCSTLQYSCTACSAPPMGDWSSPSVGSVQVDYIRVRGGMSGSHAYRSNTSRHRSPESFDNRLTLLRWTGIFSLANPMRTTSHRHPELFFDIGNPGRFGNESRVPTDAKLYFFVE